MKVLIYGIFDQYHLGASYERGFQALGHEVVRLDVHEMSHHLHPWIRSRVGYRLAIDSLAARRAGSRGWNQRFVEAVRTSAPDVAFLLNGEMLMPEALREAGRYAKVALFHADNPFERFPARRPEFLKAPREVDVYFVWSRRLLGVAEELGARNSRLLPFGWDPGIHPAGTLSSAPEHELVFIGNWDREREAWLEPLARRFSLKIWGSDLWAKRTQRSSALRRCWQGDLLHGRESADVMRSSKIVLNLVRAQNLPDGVNMRTCEVPGAGGFALSNRTSGAQELFSEGTAGAYFADPGECQARVEHYLRHDDERVSIASEAHAIVDRTLRYTHLAQQVLDGALGNSTARSAEGALA